MDTENMVTMTLTVISSSVSVDVFNPSSTSKDGKVPCLQFECLEFVFGRNGQNVPREVWVSEPESMGRHVGLL